jgi:hypothetical protein
LNNWSIASLRAEMGTNVSEMSKASRDNRLAILLGCEDDEGDTLAGICTGDSFSVAQPNLTRSSLQPHKDAVLIPCSGGCK